MKKSFFVILLLLLAAAITVAGCGQKTVAEQNVVSGGIAVTDDNGRTVTLKGVPQRIVPLSASFLEPLAELDGKLAARVAAKTSICENYKALPEVGNVYNVNIEKVIAAQPDLVICYKGMNDKFVHNFEENNIPVIVLEMRTYGQVKNTVNVLGKITGNEIKAEKINKDMDERIAAVRAKIPEESKRIAILHSTSQSVTVQLEGSIAGSAAELLGFTNIAAGSVPLENNSTAAPYSLETLVAANPDIIYITSMGRLETVQDAMLKSIGASPAWQSLAAVRSGHVYFLPQELFLLSPGIKYPQAAEYMAKLAYPEKFE